MILTLYYKEPILTKLVYKTKNPPGG